MRYNDQLTEMIEKAVLLSQVACLTTEKGRGMGLEAMFGKHESDSDVNPKVDEEPEFVRNRSGGIYQRSQRTKLLDLLEEWREPDLVDQENELVGRWMHDARLALFLSSVCSAR